ncbi:hypothetical protein [Streptomyces sp. NPDC017991]|uniref:hypothetical protein n=1 Tax=Streptomyces sp. NPDC017991 TaxID=3365026 RepID=UPI0037B27D47
MKISSLRASNVHPTQSSQSDADCEPDMKKAIELSLQQPGDFGHAESAAESSRATQASSSAAPSMFDDMAAALDTMDRMITIHPRRAVAQAGQSEDQFESDIQRAIKMSPNQVDVRFGEASGSGQADQ